MSVDKLKLAVEALEPCPFCGGRAEVFHLHEGENAGGSCVSCTRCLASSNVEFGRKENFVSNWNRRALVAIRAPEAPGEVEALCEQLEKAALLLPIRVSDGPDYAEAFGQDFQAMTVTPDRFSALECLPEAATLIRQQQAEIERMREALTGVDDDYMTSDTHHPGYVLIPAEKFERLRTATQHEGAKRLKKPLVGNWFYPAEEGERCYFSPYEVIEEYYDPEPGKHVFEITVAAPLPSIWCAVVAVDDPDADERYMITEHASEEEARAALSQEPGR